MFTFADKIALLAKEARSRAQCPAVDPISTPLVERLKKLISTLPPQEAGLARPLEFFRVRLRGRKNRNCHHGELGDALRQLGWVRRRSWTSASRSFSNLWYPPSKGV